MGMDKKYFFTCLFVLICCADLSAIHDIGAQEEPGYVDKEGGNFSNSRTPGSYFCFGQWIQDEGTTSYYLFLDQSKGKNQSEICLSPLVVYGIADYLSVFITLPITLSSYEKPDKYRGIGDLTAQFEYVLFSKSDKKRDMYGSLIANIGLPTASRSNGEVLGYGVPSFFLGADYYMLSHRWYAYCAAGATLASTPFECVKSGHEILYEWGFGINLAGWKDNVLTLIFDFNGIYTQKDTNLKGEPDKDTGSNIMYVGPTLFYSHKKFLFAFGIQGPVYEQLNGDQDKQHFRTLTTLSYNF